MKGISGITVRNCVSQYWDPYIYVGIISSLRKKVEQNNDVERATLLK
jgi:hypothetical protein